MNLSEALKRVVIGRKLASHQLGETLLPKNCAAGSDSVPAATSPPWRSAEMTEPLNR